MLQVQNEIVELFRLDHNYTSYRLRLSENVYPAEVHFANLVSLL